RSQEEPGAGKEGPPSSLGADSKFSMEENSLYSSRDKAGREQAFEVTVRVTPSSQRCRLRGRCVLRAGEEALELRHCQSQELLFSWPYRFLRRFGRDKVRGLWEGRSGGVARAGTDPVPPQVTFSFEAGRRCASGEGNFEFDTRQGNEIFQAIEAAIDVQRGRGAEEPRWGGPGDEASQPPGHARTPSWAQGHEEPKSDLPYAEPRDSLRRGDAAVPERGWGQAAPGLEPEYAVPFDTLAKAFLARQLGGPGCVPEDLPEPQGCPREPPGRPTAPKPEHIYDEPEGLSALSLYDEPQEVKGEAWRLQAAPEEPPGHQHPYNPQRDDYAVPKRPVPLRQPFLLQGKEWLGHSDYDNVALRVAKK
ncbi:DOK2 protein, partial [Climacteris rufus]|nr:DOK2 protein [Climacteris rufus]